MRVSGTIIRAGCDGFNEAAGADPADASLVMFGMVIPMSLQ